MPLKAGPLPKHYQLSEILRRKISAGELSPGDRLPGEAALCHEYFVSRGTVRKSLNTLAHEGLIYSEQGRGTFVSARVVEPLSFTLTPFEDQVRNQYQEPSTRLLALEVLPADARTASRLEIPAREPVIHIERLRLAEGRPVARESRFLAQALCPDLVYEDLERNSIHTLLIEKYHIPLVRTVHNIEARVLSPDQAAILELQGGEPAFFVDRLTYTTSPAGEIPAVWYQAIFHGAEYTLRVEFERR